ncbi:MAG: PhoX family protein [Beijerinckiaceae bacterium]
MSTMTYTPIDLTAEEREDVPTSPNAGDTFGDVVAARFNRRDLMKGLLGVSAMAATVSPLAMAAAQAQERNTTPSFNFKEIAAGSDDKIYVAEGYDADILIRWGDPVLSGGVAFDPDAQTAEKQARQFGYNNDYLGYIPLDGSRRGLLCVNHEYTNEELMFPQVDGRQDLRTKNFAEMTKALADIEMMAHGGSVLEVAKAADGKWGVVKDSKYARRITAHTPMEITGPAAGHERMKTPDDPTGTKVFGMLNNCAGGRTPWGTWVTCEENINGYFWGEVPKGHAEERNHKRMGVPGKWANWGVYYDRFDVSKQPNEPNRFGWVVEIDPMDPNSMPKKRTALGRFKHEGAAGITNKDGRYVIYSGDDQRFDYLYKFVSRGRVDANNRAANMDLLAEGTLYAAKFNADGTMQWLPLVFGQGPLTEANGFRSQADVLIETRIAADMMGATKMDRPEDVEANPKTNRVYAMLTNNTQRKAGDENPANPRANNRFGHIVEMIPPDGDHAAEKFTWDILVKCGDPSIAEVGATFNAATSKDGWFGMPDNCAIDADGRLWVSTDGNSKSRTGRNDGLWAMETEGPARGTSKLFFRCPNGAEMCGPEFTPDGETLFLAVQHPGEADPEDSAAPPTNYKTPTTRWPDFQPHIPPRPSIVVVTKKGGGKIAV